MKRFVILFFVYHLVALIFLPMVVTWFVGSKYEIVLETEMEVEDVTEEDAVLILQ